MVWIVSWIYLTCFGFPYSGLIALLAGECTLLIAMTIIGLWYGKVY